MSAVRIDTANIVIVSYDIIKIVSKNKRFIDFSNEVIEKIVLEIIAEYKKIVNPDNKGKTAIFDDELLFDDIYDYMLLKLREIFSTADIALLVNDVISHLEDIYFDEGLIEYTI